MYFVGVRLLHFQLSRPCRDRSCRVMDGGKDHLNRRCGHFNGSTRLPCRLSWSSRVYGWNFGIHGYLCRRDAAEYRIHQPRASAYNFCQDAQLLPARDNQCFLGIIQDVIHLAPDFLKQSSYLNFAADIRIRLGTYHIVNTCI